MLARAFLIALLVAGWLIAIDEGDDISGKTVAGQHRANRQFLQQILFGQPTELILDAGGGSLVDLCRLILQGLPFA